MISLFVATPLYNGQISHMYMLGALQAQKAFSHIEFSTAVGTYLALNRQTLTDRFLASQASHLLFVDSDIGWSVPAVKALIESDVDVVSGVYLQRNGQAIIPAEPLEESQELSNGLVECYSVPAGFLLLKRRVLETMLVQCLNHWTMSVEGNNYVGEDINFCRNWRAMGGKVFLHTKVFVEHVGEVVFKMTPSQMPPRYASRAEAPPPPRAPSGNGNR